MLPTQCPMHTRPQSCVIRALTSHLCPILTFRRPKMRILSSPTTLLLGEVQDPPGKRRDLSFTVLIQPIVLKVILRRCRDVVRVMRSSCARSGGRWRCSKSADG